MKKRASLAVILLLLGIAVFQVSSVVERLVAAVFQWQHFQGTQHSGYITLSKEAAIQFYCASLLFLVAAVVAARSARASTNTDRVFSWAPATLFFIGVVTYAALSFSPLNVWRP